MIFCYIKSQKKHLMVSLSTTPDWLNENKEFVKSELQYCFAFNENKKIVKYGLLLLLKK